MTLASVILITVSNIIDTGGPPGRSGKRERGKEKEENEKEEMLAPSLGKCASHCPPCPWPCVFTPVPVVEASKGITYL